MMTRITLSESTVVRFALNRPKVFVVCMLGNFMAFGPPFEVNILRLWFFRTFGDNPCLKGSGVGAGRSEGEPQVPVRFGQDLHCRDLQAGPERVVLRRKQQAGHQASPGLVQW